MANYQIDFFDRDDRPVARMNLKGTHMEIAERLASLDNGLLRVEVRKEP
ncbi:hypothetical protein [Novosphingobium marinum]|uniref:Uncharacterized protein n=1 Tax=Novosphingobium marinum TaxID=1514948 RepID=A0A7Y9XWQ4_9SPHN|nr:hypothetical protein [Novosphingobium marinum]NYH95957.1 hypothetical protein [Novosphingobium marinum]